MNNDYETISCVECGEIFVVDDSGIDEYTNSVRCPVCGRMNYCPCQSYDGMVIDSFVPDGSEEDTDELYTENYLSNDLVPLTTGKIGKARRKNILPKMPIFEARRKISEALCCDNIDEVTKSKLKEILDDSRAVKRKK